MAGGTGGAFAGHGGTSGGDRNASGEGGGGAGLGGAIFVRAGSLLVETFHFVDGAASGGVSAEFEGVGVGGNGQGKAAATFTADSVVARAYRVTFEGNDANDANGVGFLPGVRSDSDDVYGIVLDQHMFGDDFE